jgi:Fur family peroxide stress response transcriptional regulator
MRSSESTRRERTLARLEAAVRGAGVKLTHQRLEILRELARTEAHPDAETIFRAVQERVPTVSLDTVYRTLWMLRDLGLVTTLGPSRHGVRFDVNLDRHHHYVCVRCGLVRDFESEALDGLRIPEAVTTFGSVVGAQVEVRGLCASCQDGPRAMTEEKRDT